MRAYVNILLVIGAFASAGATYYMKYQARILELELKQTVRNIEKRGREIKILQGELSYLSRPERIDRLSRDLLHVRPTKQSQYMDVKKLPARKKKSDQTTMSLEKQNNSDMTQLIKDIIVRGQR